jgi:DNA-binding CsgD family transcriptional regulator
MTTSGESFTKRQLEIIEAIAAGQSNEEIGAMLGISPRTVRAHCDALRVKLRASRREIPLAYRLRTGADPFSAASPDA